MNTRDLDIRNHKYLGDFISLYFSTEKRYIMINDQLYLNFFHWENVKESVNSSWRRIVSNNFQLCGVSSEADRRAAGRRGSLAVSLVFVSFALHSTRAHRFADHHPLLGNLWLATCRYMMAAGVDNRCGCSVSLFLSSLLLLLSLPPTCSLSLSFYLPLCVCTVRQVALVDQTVITTNVSYILTTPSDTPRTSGGVYGVNHHNHPS